MMPKMLAIAEGHGMQGGRSSSLNCTPHLTRKVDRRRTFDPGVRPGSIIGFDALQKTKGVGDFCLRRNERRGGNADYAATRQRSERGSRRFEDPCRAAREKRTRVATEPGFTAIGDPATQQPGDPQAQQGRQPP